MINIVLYMSHKYAAQTGLLLITAAQTGFLLITEAQTGLLLIAEAQSGLLLITFTDWITADRSYSLDYC